MEKLLFIINPIAGGDRAKKLIPLIEEVLKKTNTEYEIIETTEPEEAIQIAEKSSHHNIVAVGGDGTINEVAKGLIRRGFGTLGIITGGTGNDLSKSLNLPKDPKALIDCILKGNTIKIDTGIANNQEFLNIASVGFDAEVVSAANKIKKRIKLKGKFAYVLGVLYTLFFYKKKKVTIDIDGKTYERNIILMAVGNGSYYGGGMKIIPHASLIDGNLHICIVKDISNLKILFLFPSIFKGNHLRYKKYVETFKGKNINIKLSENTSFNLDGDIFKGDNNIQLKLSEYKLQVFK